MNFNDLNSLVPWLMAHGYLIFLIVATIEGPLTTIAAGIIAALGYFNIYIIIFLAVLADIGGDVMYFGIGYGSHKLMKLSFFKYLGLNERRLEKMKELVHTRLLRALLIVKISPFIGPLGLVVIGSTRPKLKAFFWPALILSIPKSFFFILLGFYSGQAYVELNKIIAQGQYIAMGIALVLGIVYFVYIKLMGRISDRIKKE